MATAELSVKLQSSSGSRVKDFLNANLINILAAILFLLLGMLYERYGTLEMAELGGVWKFVPALGVFLLIAMLASVGLPGLNGFVGEFLILLGVFRVNQTYAAFAALTMILGAWYTFNLYRQVMQGPAPDEVEKRSEAKGIRDLSTREVITLLPIVVLIFVIGLFPDLVFDRTDAAARNLAGEEQIVTTTSEPALATEPE